MPAFLSNPDLLVAALLREARDQPSPRGWVRQLQKCYFTDWSAGDAFAQNITSEGGSTSWLREIPANQGAQLCEIALQRIEAEAAAEEADEGVPVGNSRGFDFGSAPSILG